MRPEAESAKMKMAAEEERAAAAAVQALQDAQAALQAEADRLAAALPVQQGIGGGVNDDGNKVKPGKLSGAGQWYCGRPFPGGPQEELCREYTRQVRASIHQICRQISVVHALAGPSGCGDARCECA